MITIDCPAEGCDRVLEGDTATEAIDSARGHINGSPDENHVWEELEPEVRAQTPGDAPGEGSATTPEGEGKSKDGDGVDGGGDTTPEGSSQGATSSATEGGSDSDKMPTDEEYQRQQAQTTPDEGDESKDGGGSDEGGSTTPDKGGSGLPIPALDTRTTLLLLGLLAVLAVVYLATRDTEGETTPEGGAEREPDTPQEGTMGAALQEPEDSDDLEGFNAAEEIGPEGANP